jgi:hypothetical protein
MNGMNAMTILGDDALATVSGGHGRHKGRGYTKKVEQSVTQGQNQSVDIGGDVTLKGNASLTITFGDQSQSASQSA